MEPTISDDDDDDTDDDDDDIDDDDDDDDVKSLHDGRKSCTQLHYLQESRTLSPFFEDHHHD